MKPQEFIIKSNEHGLSIIGFPIGIDYDKNEGYLLFDFETAERLAEAIKEEIIIVKKG